MTTKQRSYSAACGTFLAGLAVPMAGCGPKCAEVTLVDGDYGQADAEVVAVRVCPSSNEDCQEGVRYLWTEEWDDAVERFEAAVAAQPNDHQAWFGLGVAHEQLKRMDKAEDAYHHALLVRQCSQYDEAYDRVRGRSGSTSFSARK